MKTDIVLLTIKFSGTHYAKSVLRRLGVRSIDDRHLCVHYHDALSLPENTSVVLTRRNPVDIYISWKSRYAPHVDFTDELMLGLENWKLAKERYGAHVFNVDGDEKNEIDALADWLGVERKLVTVPDEHRNVYQEQRWRGRIPEYVYGC